MKQWASQLESTEAGWKWGGMNLCTKPQWSTEQIEAECHRVHGDPDNISDWWRCLYNLTLLQYLFVDNELHCYVGGYHWCEANRLLNEFWKIPGTAKYVDIKTSH